MQTAHFCDVLGWWHVNNFIELLGSGFHAVCTETMTKEGNLLLTELTFVIV